MSSLPPSKSDSDDRLMAMFAHLSVLVGLSILGPIILLIIKKESPFIQDQCKEALNFQLSMLILTFATCGIAGLACIPMLLIFSIIAGLEANKGVAYRYPFTFRMVT
jgi:uncharacterized Tic20 family protein